MTNVNSAAELAQYAEEHDIDLTGYGESLVEIASWGKPIDLESPFAEHVLERLRTGDGIADAIAAARLRFEELHKPTSD